MKKIILMAVVLSGLVAPLRAMDTNVLNNENAKISYALGMFVGGQLKQSEYDLNTEVYMRGLKDSLAGGATLLTQPEFKDVMTQFNTMMRSKQKDLMAKMAAKNQAEGQAFLATNKNNPGVITLPSGVQYKVEKNGDGPMPKASDTVMVNYVGTSLNGVEFESNTKAGHPVPQAVTGPVKGLTEALQQMKVGSKWQIYVPGELAYGSRGSRTGVQPNSTVIYEVELVGIEPPRAPPAPRAPPHAPPTQNPPLTSDIIKVPSQEEMAKGAKIEQIKPEDVQKYLAQSATNQPATNAPTPPK